MEPWAKDRIHRCQVFTFSARLGLVLLHSSKRQVTQSALIRSPNSYCEKLNGMTPPSAVLSFRCARVYNTRPRLHTHEERKRGSFIERWATRRVRKGSWFHFAGRRGGRTEGGANHWQQLVPDWTGNQWGWRGGAERCPQEGPRSARLVPRWLKLGVTDMSGEKQKVASECATEMRSTPPTPIHVQCEGEVKQLMCY